MNWCLTVHQCSEHTWNTFLRERLFWKIISDEMILICCVFVGKETPFAKPSNRCLTNSADYKSMYFFRGKFSLVKRPKRDIRLLSQILFLCLFCQLIPYYSPTKTWSESQRKKVQRIQRKSQIIWVTLKKTYINSKRIKIEK